jgi:ABC-2 type transport system ATP-binding protein
MEYICVLKDIPKTDHKQQIERVMEEVNLIDVEKKRIGAYSGGMRQRLGLPRPFWAITQVLVFDEPTAGLDPIERIRFRNTLSGF